MMIVDRVSDVMHKFKGSYLWWKESKREVKVDGSLVGIHEADAHSYFELSPASLCYLKRWFVHNLVEMQIVRLSSTRSHQDLLIPRFGFSKLACRWNTTFLMYCPMFSLFGPRTNAVHWLYMCIYQTSLL